MRLHFSLGHLTLNLTLCEDDDGQTVDLTSQADFPFGFTPDEDSADEWTEPDPDSE